MNETPEHPVWHEMLDAICLERGHIDNAALAADLCTHLGTQEEAAFDAALKNLSNWRRGQHLPHRRNYAALTEVLGIAGDVDRLREWDEAYRRAKAAPKAGAESDDEQPDDVRASIPIGIVSRYGRLPIAGAALTVLTLALGYLFYPHAAERPDEKTPVGLTISPVPIDMTGQQIYWHEYSRLRVGEYAVIHGKRNRCGLQPPPWDNVLLTLPEVSNGIWHDGGVGYRVSRACGGATPARAIIFEATAPGTANFMLYEDPITIEVE